MARTPRSQLAIAMARGDVEADLLLVGGKVFSSATREWVETSLAIGDGAIVGWGDRGAKEVVDVSGAYLIPSFIDAHMHLESTKLWVDEFVSLVLAAGTTAVVADPHELANVFGIPGVAELIDAASDLPFTFKVVASSCVPASQFESPGAEISVEDIEDLMDHYGAIGVAEVMNYPGVIAGDPIMLKKIASAKGKRVDGHAPMVRGKSLDAYLTAGVESDHECTSFEEAHEKRQKGMWIFIREGSASKNLNDLIKTVLVGGTDRIALCTDDREPSSLIRRGHVNDCVAMAVAAGVSPEDAIIIGSTNAAQYHNLHDLGSLAPGYQADLLVLDNLVDFKPSRVYVRGSLVAQNGTILEGVVPSRPAPSWMQSSVRLARQFTKEDFEIEVDPDKSYKVIGVHHDSLSTTHLVRSGSQVADCARIAVIERHRGTGRFGLGLVSGFNLTQGAIASTVAHDAHNIMVLGSMAQNGASDMAIAIETLNEIGGGQVAVLDGQVIAVVPLIIGGLISTKRATEIAAELENLEAQAHSSLGITLPAPFMVLSFLGLSVIPELRITDLGLIDVVSFTKTTLTN